ncbi:hypothetical protein [Solibacillus merdavium]|uniref:Phage protein n=1 Tax=Solibacillus merdavium TaxID=2762218 RepID=A0ABR8XJS9_9BACL|nr:hypothetical protein [Solibacillus merdavium]MBD8032189.1 hypothetical protein [Solibacillus merdavium]
MDFSKFDELPDYLSEEILKMYFEQVIDYYENNGDISKIDLSEAIYQLAERQWHTYKYLDEKIKDKVDSIVQEILDPNSYELMDNVTSIIAYLGLSNSFQTLKEIDSTSLSINVKEVIEETINELDGNIGNPYSGLEE